MLASNFPLCLLGREPSNELENRLDNKNYASYWQDILESSVIKQCNKNEKNALLYNNAFRIYQFANAEN
jgi:L-fuconolactonase